MKMYFTFGRPSVKYDYYDTTPFLDSSDRTSMEQKAHSLAVRGPPRGQDDLGPHVSVGGV